MLLTIREAATVLGCTERAVRARLARGTLKGFKKRGRWQVPKEHLDLSPSQRRKLRGKADTLRAAVEAGLPGGGKSLTLTDLAPFVAASQLVRTLDAVEHPSADLQDARADLVRGLALLSEGHHQFHRDEKLLGFRGARAAFCHALARVGLAGQPEAVVRGIQADVLPPLAGLIRWAEGLRAA